MNQESRPLSKDESGRRPLVLLTDHAWPDPELERALLDAAGIDLACGPAVAGDALAIARLIGEVRPEAILTCWAPVDAAAMAAAPALKAVVRMGIGLDNIDLDAASDRGAWVANVPDYCTSEVADHAVALILSASRGVVTFDRAAKKGCWNPAAIGLDRLSTLTVGILGFGRIGRATAKRLIPFGMRILAHSRRDDDIPPGVAYATLGQIQLEADIIVLHLPLTEQTRHVIDTAFLAGCRRAPLIVNVGRGPLVDNEALLEALNGGGIRGAALDVIEGEPAPPPTVMEHPGIIVTPHISFSSNQAIEELRRRACNEIIRVLGGQPPLHACNTPTVGTPLDGGVASDIRVVHAGGRTEVVKRALTRLRVEADWFADPARSLVEVAALEVAGDLLGPDAVPGVLWADPAQHAFAMTLVPERFGNWKTALLSGRIDLETAAAAGLRLGQLHRRSAGREDIRRRFGDTRHFLDLRIEPFFERTAERSPGLSDAILRAAAELGDHRSALVHGDYSPKNILADRGEIVVLDWEVAHWGDPRFDVAFCLSHLVLKGLRIKADHDAYRSAATAFAQAYRAENEAVWDARMSPLIGSLILARLDGASPVDYRADLDETATRRVARELLESDGTAALRCIVDD